jgi:hypothetical protein
MLNRSLTPSITVTIGHHTRLYFAFITTAPAELDSPATITLLADTLLELSCYAEDPFSLDTTRSRYASRLVLVDAFSALGSAPNTRGTATADRRGSPYGGLQHAAGNAVAPVADRQSEPGRRMTPRSTAHPRQPLAATASFSGGHIMVVKITPNDKGNPPGKLADAELHFTDGELDGMKLIGFAIWERRSGGGRNVTFPARQYVVNGDRRSFALLRPITDTQAQERVRERVLQAYAEYEENRTEAAS